MRILTVASEVPPVRSGVARSVDRVVSGLREAGHSVTVMSYADGWSVRRDRVRISDLGLRLAFRGRYLRSFDLVHLHGPAPLVSDVLLARWRLADPGVPLVYTHHFTVSFDHRLLDWPSRYYDRLTRRLTRSNVWVVTTTASYRDHLGGDSCRVIPWGVDGRDGVVRVPSSGPLRVLLVGQMRSYKGHHVAIRAVRGATDIELTIAGAGPLLGEIRADVDDEPNIRVVSGLDDAALAELYDHSDVVLLPSTNASEAFGITLLEGMASGCVPVASDLPGVRDVAATGRLFPPGDAGALRAELDRLHADRDELCRGSARALEFAADHSWERTVASYVAMIEGVGEAGSV